MQGHPLRAEGGVPAEITQAEDVVDRQRVDADPVELLGITEIDILADFYVIEKKQGAVIARTDQDAGVLNPSVMQEGAGPEEVLNKASFLGNDIIIRIHPRIRPLQIQLLIPARCHGHIVPLWYVLRGAKSIDIVGLIEVLPEESELAQYGLPVIETKVEFVADLIRHVIEMIPEGAQTHKFPVPDGSIADKPVRSQVPAHPEIMDLVMIFVEEAIHMMVTVKGLKIPQRDPPRQMGVRSIERPVEPDKTGHFIRRIIEQIPVDLRIGQRSIDKGIADIGFTIQQLVTEVGIAVLFQDHPTLNPLTQSQKIRLTDIPAYAGWPHPQAPQGPADTKQIFYHNHQVHRVLVVGQEIHEDTRILDIIQTTDQSLIIRHLESIQRRILFYEKGIADDPVPCLTVHLVEDLGAEILQPLGRIGKGLLETIILNDDTPDNLALVRHKGRFTLGIDRAGEGGRVGMSFRNRIAEKLKDIIIHEPVHMPAGRIPHMGTVGRILRMPAAAILHLTKRTDKEQTASHQKPDMYYTFLAQASF